MVEKNSRLFDHGWTGDWFTTDRPATVGTVEMMPGNSCPLMAPGHVASWSMQRLVSSLYLGHPLTSLMTPRFGDEGDDDDGGDDDAASSEDAANLIMIMHTHRMISSVEPGSSIFGSSHEAAG